MAFMLFQRKTTGKDFSEGARLIWEALDSGWTVHSIAEGIGCKRMAVHRYMYGDSRPSRKTSLALQSLLGIDPHLFDVAPSKPFAPPGVSAATGTEG